MKTRTVIEIARKLVNRLPNDMADELNELIVRDEQAPGDPTTDIIEVLTRHENSLLWFLEQMESQGERRDETRGFSSLAGDSSAPFSQKWLCPKDKADSLPVMQEGEPAPLCEKHNVEMVRG